MGNLRGNRGKSRRGAVNFGSFNTLHVAKKVVFVGNCGSGKTSVLNQLLHYSGSSQHICTLGVTVHPVVLDSAPNVTFNIWDTAGKHQYLGLFDGYVILADIVIVFGGGQQYKSIPEWAAMAMAVAPEANVHMLETPSVENVRNILAMYV